MKILFSQGNPGSQYASTRHNVGFQMLDLYAQKYGVDFSQKPKFHAQIAEFTQEGEKILLVKPATFYNETGQSARKLFDFYKVDPSADFLVIHDDLSLPFGTIRTREKGSDAGNNGIKSLNAHIGQHHKRIRVGIYSDLRDRMPDADFVLGNFTQNEKTVLAEDIYPLIERHIDNFIRGRFVLTKQSLPAEQKEGGEAHDTPRPAQLS